MSSDIFTLIKQLIEIPSEQSKKEELFRIISFVKECFANTDVVIREYECNGFPSIVISNKETKEFDIVLSGHLDVVPADDILFEPKEDDEYIYGRGAYDMKSGVAVMMSVLKELKRDDISVALMLTTDEEVGGFHGTKYLLETQGYSARVAIIPDGGYKESQIALKEKGILHLCVSATGVGAHGSRPWEGQNAIEIVLRAVDAVQKELLKEQTNDPLHWYTTSTLSTIHGGNSKNTVPDAAEATFDIRYIETTYIEEIVQRIEMVAVACGAQVNVLFQEPHVCVDPQHQYIGQYVTAMEQCGLSPVMTHDYGASDARFFATKNIPVILSQPAGEGMHVQNERVSKVSVEKYHTIVKKFIADFVV